MKNHDLIEAHLSQIGDSNKSAYLCACHGLENTADPETMVVLKAVVQHSRNVRDEVQMLMAILHTNTNLHLVESDDEPVLQLNFAAGVKEDNLLRSA